ncbi:hypothetical protein FACS1894151_06190 [Spirochaetia bacterium]|nr:hypothetical protein FACS1894151_06190 [Spirochaetia bacterium]
MQDLFPLAGLYSLYRSGELGKKDFEGYIFKAVLENYEAYEVKGWDKEDFTDFLCWLYPRFSRAIDRYADIGSSFDSYIHSMVHWSIKEYRRRQMEHQIVERTYWNEKNYEMTLKEEEPSYLEEKKPDFEAVPNPRQVLFLLLKSYYHISEDFAQRVAGAIGMEKGQLMELIKDLREIRLEQEEEIRSLQERIYSQYYRVVSYEKRMRTSLSGMPYHERMKKCYHRGMKRLSKMRGRLNKLRTEASNRQIANLLGIAKGTVDSNLFAVRARRSDDEGEDDNPSIPVVLCPEKK